MLYYKANGRKQISGIRPDVSKFNDTAQQSNADGATSDFR